MYMYNLCRCVCKLLALEGLCIKGSSSDVFIIVIHAHVHVFVHILSEKLLPPCPMAGLQSIYMSCNYA